MTSELRNTEAGRNLYNQLRLNLSFPGEVVATVRKPYAPVNRDALSWDEIMLTPDTPAVARLRRYEKTMWLSVGVH